MDKSNRQLQKEQTRQKILDTAFNEFGKNGIMATRMSDIAKAAGVSHGTVFMHFKTQEALISAVIEEYGRKTSMRIHELSEYCSDIREILEAHLKSIAKYEPFYTNLVIETRLLPKSSRDALISIQSAVSFHMSTALEHSIAERTIINEPVYLLFNTWMGLVDYYIANSDLFAPKGSVIERYGKQLIKLYMNLITVKK